jgi:hypothetical protein
VTSQVVVAPPRGIVAPALVQTLRRRIETDALAIAVIAAWTSLLALSMPKLVVQDTWLAFVDGRLIARSGLPHVDTLTYWSLGRTWTDQQWGAHLALYELERLGGLRAALLAGIACVTAALLVALVVTRKLGASPRSAAIGMLLPLVGAPWLTQVRTQSLALLPFVLLYGLLASDAHRPGRRVLLVLPLLGVWANLHGSVALASGLTALYGLTLLGSGGRRRVGAVLALGAPVCVLASPYGFALVAYYRLMLLHPPLADFVREWKPADVEAATALFFLSAFGITALLARHHRSVTSFERWALALLLVGALTAVRNAVWFELAAAISFPRLLDAAWPSGAGPTLGVRRVNLVLGSAATVAAALVVATHAARPPAWLDADRSPAAAAAVAAAAGPNGIVIADDEHADWLLWQQPSLQGRVAYDVRFELFERRELVQISRLQQASPPAWRRCGVEAAVVTFAGRAELRRFETAGVLAPGARTIARGKGFAAVAQGGRATPCRL